MNPFKFNLQNTYNFPQGCYSILIHEMFLFGHRFYHQVMELCGPTSQRSSRDVGRSEGRSRFAKRSPETKSLHLEANKIVLLVGFKIWLLFKNHAKTANFFVYIQEPICWLSEKTHYFFTDNKMSVLICLYILFVLVCKYLCYALPI